MGLEMRLGLWEPTQLETLGPVIALGWALLEATPVLEELVQGQPPGPRDVGLDGEDALEELGGLGLEDWWLVQVLEQLLGEDALVQVLGQVAPLFWRDHPAFA